MNTFEWKILLDQYSDDALKLLANYSDLTFEKVMKSVKYLEKRTHKLLQLIKCTASEMMTIGVEVPSHSGIDLLNPDCLNDISEKDTAAYRSFKKTEQYSKSREHQIFELIESGCKVVDEKLYIQLDLLRQARLN